MRIAKKYRFGVMNREINLQDDSLDYRHIPIIGNGVDTIYQLCPNNPNRVYLWISYLTANNLSIWPESLQRSDAVFAVPMTLEGFKVSIFNDFMLPTLEWWGQFGSPTGVVNVVEVFRRK